MSKADSGRVDVRELAQVLSHVGVDIVDLAFTPSWEGVSYVGSDRTGRRLFVKAFDPEWRPSDLEATLAGALGLRDRCGVLAVVPPMRLADGSLVVEVCRHSVVLFELIDGFALADGTLSSEHREQAADVVRTLHASADCLRGQPLPAESFTLGFEGLLSRVQSKALEKCGPDSAAEEAAALIRSAEHEIAEALSSMRGFRSDAPLVPTHGDLNPGNFIQQVDGTLRVIDWTKLLFAPRERDLICFADGNFPEFLEAYTRGARPVVLDPSRFEFYARRERLASIVDYGSLLLLEESTEEDRAHALSELRQVVSVDEGATVEWMSWISDCVGEVT